MPIESSGAISLGTTAGTNRSISAEFGGTQPHSLSEYYRDGSYSDGISIPSDQTSIPASGAISFSDFYGTSSLNLENPTAEVNMDINGTANTAAIAQVKFIASTKKFQGILILDGTSNTEFDNTWTSGTVGDYDVRVTYPGTTPSSTYFGPTIGSWHQLNADRTFQWTWEPGFADIDSFDVKVDISAATDNSTILDTVTFTITLETS